MKHTKLVRLSMPTLIPRACRKRGCPGTTTDRSGFCEKHRNEGWQQHQQGKSRHERGYGSQWDIRRARILKRDNHLCQNCLRSGRAVAAKTVDHIKAKAHGGPMTIRTSKACAGPATVTRPPRRERDELHALHLLRFKDAHCRKLP